MYLKKVYNQASSNKTQMLREKLPINTPLCSSIKTKTENHLALAIIAPAQLKPAL